MARDFVRDLGLLTLGSRMKRIGERLQSDATRIAAARGATAQASQYPFLGALDARGELTIGELAAALGITQPGVTHAVGELSRQGLVKGRPGRADQRQRIISLTAKGRAEVALAKRAVWPAVAASVEDLCRDFAAPLLDHLATIEAGLAEKPLDARVPVNAVVGAGKRKLR